VPEAPDPERLARAFISALDIANTAHRAFRGLGHLRCNEPRRLLKVKHELKRRNKTRREYQPRSA
jgi:hypothetical protein